MRLKICFTAIISTFLLAACSSADEQESMTTDIATPGDFTAQNTMLWYDNDVVVAGFCTLNAPIVRANCQAVVARRALIDVTVAVDASITADISRIHGQKEQEIVRLRNEDPVVVSLRQQIAQLGTDIAAQTTLNSQLETQLQTLVQSVQRKNLEIAQIEQQITEVDRRLSSNPSDQELQRLRNQLSIERSNTILSRDEAERQRLIKEGELASGRNTLAGKLALKNQKEFDLNDRLRSLQVASARLDELIRQENSLNTQRTGVPNIFAELRDGALVYRVNTFTNIDISIVNRILVAMGLRTTAGSFQETDIRQISGYLEVRSGAEWRGVCDDSFDAIDAEVACHMALRVSTGFATGVNGPVSFWLDDLACIGTEASLFNCLHSNLGTHNCGASENVQVQCN